MKRFLGKAISSWNYRITECLNSVHVAHVSQIFVIPYFDLLQFMGGAEAVEEVNEGNAALNSCQVSNGSQVHNFLYVGFSQHSKAGLTAGVYIGVVAEDVKSVRSHAASRYMENAGE